LCNSSLGNRKPETDRRLPTANNISNLDGLFLTLELGSIDVRRFAETEVL
jgi:hypothetical protein